MVHNPHAKALLQRQHVNFDGDRASARRPDRLRGGCRRGPGFAARDGGAINCRYTPHLPQKEPPRGREITDLRGLLCGLNSAAPPPVVVLPRESRVKSVVSFWASADGMSSWKCGGSAMESSQLHHGIMRRSRLGACSLPPFLRSSAAC